MAAFACPECGNEVAAENSVAGRRVRCAECGTIVEIPFLARSAVSRQRYSRRSPTMLIVGGGLLAALLMIGIAILVAISRGRSNREHQVAEAVERSKKLEGEGLFHQALEEIESALKVAKTLGPEARKPLKERRDQLAVRETEAALTAIATSPDAADKLRELRKMIDQDRAREPARDRVNETLAAALITRSEADIVQANSAMATGHPELALELCERVAAAAEELGRERAGNLRPTACGVAREIIARFGVVFDPLTGDYLQGPAGAKLHAATLQPVISNALKKKGFMPRPEKSAFLNDWDDVAPYHFAIEITERNDGVFFQSVLHTFRIHSHFALKKGTRALWQTRPQGQTRVPPPDMNAFEMSQISTAKQRDPALEKRLYNDARAVLGDNLSASLRNLPSP